MAKSILNQQNDRVNYGDMLCPEDGYSLDFAVGMTYSLDLETLLGVPISLGMLEDIDSNHKNNPYFLLEAIRRSADKIAIFCNADSIKMPQNIRPVFALLEKSVFPILLPHKANFHPKLWVLRYSRSNSDAYIKVIVLSRNMTFDRSFDVAVEMRGAIGKSESQKHRPLSDLLEYVAGKASADKRKHIRKLAQDVLRVGSFGLMDEFDDYNFYPFGINQYKKTAMPLLANKDNYEIIVVSPFVSEGVLQDLSNIPRKTKLITRRASITPKVLELFDEVYATKDAVMTDDMIEEEDAGKAGRDVHAKIYFTYAYTGEAKKSVFIGSLNASQNAFYNNVEFLVELKCKPMSRIQTMLINDLIMDENSAFEKVASVSDFPGAPGEEEPVADFRDALGADMKATILPAGDRFEIRVDARTEKLASPVKIAPLYKHSALRPLESATLFGDMLLKDLSGFFILKRGNASTITKIPTTGLPVFDRDSAIFKAIIGTKQDFLKYVAFMLSDDFAETFIEQGFTHDSTDEKKRRVDIPPAIYESLLRTAARAPARLDDIEEVMSFLDDDIVMDEFRKLLESVRAAAKRGRKKP